jgi:Big-like domain-containing protein
MRSLGLVCTHPSHSSTTKNVLRHCIGPAVIVLSMGATAAWAATAPCTLKTTDPSVTICTPAPNATVSSPVHVVAGTTSSKAVTVTQIYVDGVKAAEVSGGTIDKSVSMAVGARRLTVQAYNGTWFRSTVNITVQSGTSSCTPGSTQPSVTICTPAPNATVTSPVHVVATSNSSPPASTLQIYLDGKAVFTVKAASLDTSISAASGTHRLTVQASNGTIFKSTENITVSGGTPPPPGNFSGIFTYKNDNSRIGANKQESTLTPSNVKSSTFGKKFTYSVDGNVFAQPLYVPNLTINGVVRNVLFIATEHDSVYAFDADGKTLSPLWKSSFLDSAAGITTVPACQTCGRTSLGPEVGITGTPAIDPNTNTLYVSAMTSDNGTVRHRLHALDLLTGAEKFGGPVVIQASVPGKGSGNDGLGNVPFDNSTQNQRPGLLLLNGVVYIASAAYSDVEPYHGWIIGYDAQSLGQVAVFNATPDTSAGGIWHGGCAPSADSNGNLYVMTGNGHFDSTGKEWGQSFLKLNGSLQVVDYFTPYNWSTINATDLDIGSGCPALLPTQSGTAHPNLLVSGTKDGKIYVIDRDLMGKFQSGSNSQIPQTINLNPANVTSGTRPRMYSSPAYWNGHVYTASANLNLRSYTLSNSHLTLSSQSNDHFTSRGPIPVVSGNGTTNGIVWLADRITSSGVVVLRAYNAANVSQQIYSSAQNSTRDSIGNGMPFTVPTVANGRVYVGAKGKVAVFGLLP